MFGRIRHHFSQTAPALLLSGALLGAWRVASTLRGVAGAGPASGLTALLGDGIDEFSVRLGSTGSTISSMIVDSNTWIGVTAIAATGITVMTSVRQLTGTIRNPGDAASMLRHVTTRLSSLLGNSRARTQWGTIHDSQTGAPLPYARVEVMDSNSRVVATSVSDRKGAFGFAVPLSDIQQHGGIGHIEIQKGGYEQQVIKPQVHTQNHYDLLRVTMAPGSPVNCARAGMQSAMTAALATVAFCGGVLTVPMLALSMPGTATTSIAILFGFATIARAAFSSGTRNG